MLIFIDLETTGVEVEDKLCSIALLYDKTYAYTLVNEGKKITPLASSVHHITNEMLEQELAFTQTEIYHFLKENNNINTTLVSHNIPFILENLASAGLFWKGASIDVQRVSKHLIKEIDTYTLQNLRYELKLYRDELALLLEYGIKDALYAHHALLDAIVIKSLYKYLEDMVDMKTMQNLSFENILLEKFSFGKYKGKYMQEICTYDRAYVEWLLTNAQDLDEDIKYSIHYYLQGES